MVIKLGTDTVNKFYIGSNEVNRIYLGNTMVFENAAVEMATGFEVFGSMSFLENGTIVQTVPSSSSARLQYQIPEDVLSKISDATYICITSRIKTVNQSSLPTYGTVYILATSSYTSSMTWAYGQLANPNASYFDGSYSFGYSNYQTELRQIISKETIQQLYPTWDGTDWTTLDFFDYRTEIYSDSTSKVYVKRPDTEDWTDTNYQGTSLTYPFTNIANANYIHVGLTYPASSAATLQIDLLNTSIVFGYSPDQLIWGWCPGVYTATE